MIKFSFRAGSVYEIDRELPRYAKFVLSKCQITGSFTDFQKESNIKPELSSGEIAHDMITFSNYKEHEKLWKRYLIDDVLCLPYVVSKHGNSIKK